jgi:hypothetical protein
MAMTSSENNDDSLNQISSVFGPAQIDHMLRQSLQFCWMGLPKHRRTAEEWESQIRRIFERAIRDFKEDLNQFSP